MKVIGERVKERRKLVELSQGDLGALVGISAQAISNIERGRTESVSINRLELMSRYCKCTIEYLSGDSDDPDKNAEGLIVPIVFLDDYVTVDDFGEMVENSKEMLKLVRKANRFLNKKKKGFII